jgi:hypothetical protein
MIAGLVAAIHVFIVPAGPSPDKLVDAEPKAGHDEASA